VIETRERPVDMALHFAVERFLVDEAALLDDGEFHAWLALMAPEIRYWMPAQANRSRKDAAKRIDDRSALPYFDETWEHLRQRVARLDTGIAWAEEPPSRTRRFVTNFRITHAEGDRIRAKTNLLLHRSRRETNVQQFVASRDDLLRAEGDGFLIVARTIVLDTTTIPAQNLSVFF
jgi:3-phenylpropionate/cinnamic acid dioxygenase small subunit